MSEGEAFDRILASLHDVALDRGHWSTATALIDEALRTHGSSMAYGAGRSGKDIRIYSTWCFHHGQRRQDLEREYYECYYPVDERVPRARNLPDSRLFHITDLLTEAERKSSLTYNEMLPRGHAQNSVTVRLAQPDGFRIIWVVNDPLEGDGWSSAQLDLIRRLLPHFRQSLCTRHALAGAGVLGASLTKLLDFTGLGIVQLDGRGRIVAANDRARDLLRSNDCLFDEGGFLYARASEDNARLQGLLTRALPPFGVQSAGGSTMVRRTSALPPLVLHVNPVGRQETDERLWPVAALVLVVDPASQIRIDPAVAVSVLGLTRTESRVAVLLAKGMNVCEVAAATGRKESTIRSHVKNMFTKHGLSRQADLVRLVLSLAGASGSQR